MRHFHSPSAVFYGRVISIVLNLLAAGIVGQALGPFGRGIASYAVVGVLMISALLGFGFPQAARKAAKEERLAEALGNTLRIVALTFIASIPMGILMASMLDGLVGRMTQVVFAIAIASTPLLTYARVLQASLNGQARYLAYAVAIAGQPASLLLLVGGFELAGLLSLNSLLLIHLSSMVFALAIALILVRTRPEKTQPLRYVRYSISYVPRDVAMALRERLDLLLVFWFLGASFAGLYSVAIAIGSLPTLISQAIANAAFNVAKKGNLESQTLTKGFLQVSLLISVGFSVVIGIVSPFFVPWFFGEPFAQSVQLIWVLLVFRGIGASLSAIPEAVLLATGHERQVPLQGLFGLLLFASLAALVAQSSGGMVFVAVFYAADLALGAIWTARARINPLSGWVGGRDTWRKLLFS